LIVNTETIDHALYEMKHETATLEHTNNKVCLQDTADI